MGDQRRRVTGILLIVWACSLAGCLDDPLRDNPVDPLAEGVDRSALVAGTVGSRAQQPLAGVAVTLARSDAAPGFTTDTDGAGRYEIAVPPGSYALTFALDGYAPFHATLDAEAGLRQERSATLNGAPRVDSAGVTAHHISRVWPPPADVYQYRVVVRAADADGTADLERVWMEVPELGLVDTLEVTPVPGLFEAVRPAETLPGGRVHDLVGTPIQVYVRDRLGEVSPAGAPLLARVIEDTPLVLAPQAGTLVTVEQPALSWVCTDVPYIHTYRVDVVRVDAAVQNLAAAAEGLVPEAVCDAGGTGTVPAPAPLDAGSYFWTVSIVDTFGNLSRSKEAGFLVDR